MIILRTTARHLFPTHQGTYIDNISLAHSAANIITQRKLGGAEVSKPQHYLLGIPRHVLKWQWARLPGQRGPAGLKQEVSIPDTGALCDQYCMVTDFTGPSGRRLMGLVSASLGVWRRSSSPRMKYEYFYITDMYRPLRRWTIPTIDRDTDPYRSNLPIYQPYGHTA